LNQLFSAIKATLNPLVPNIVETVPIYNDFREGDMRHSLADISRARTLLSYEPHYSLKDGLREAARWYIGQLKI
jgi:UDP-N-acetylglucosamine 4-epimerase